MFTSGGGGFGDPRMRDPEAVAKDVERGMVSIEAAARDYAVIVDPASFKVQAEATVKLREIQPSSIGRAVSSDKGRGLGGPNS
jgi:N-methylhydantoinase B